MNLAVCLRVYPGQSKTPLIQGEKIFTFNLCLQSFLSGIKDFRSVDLTVILDNCPEEFKKCIIDKARFHENLSLSFDEKFESGNQGTFKRQIEILSTKENFDFLLFLEDDYLFVPNWFDDFNEQLASIQRLDYFFTGFRTSDYEEILLHKLFDKKRYLNTEISTTLTFFCTPTALRKSKKAFGTFVYGNFDSVLWLMITDNLFLIRLLFLFLLVPDRVNLSRLYKGIRYFKWMKKFPLFVSSPSFMIHLDERGFPERMRWLISNQV